MSERSERRQQEALKVQEVSSSLPGIGQMYRATSHPKKIMWMVIVLVCLFQTILQTTEIISQYFQYPVTVSVTTVTNQVLKCPAVTICPAAHLSCHRLASSLLQELKDGDNNTTDHHNTSAFTSQVNPTTESPLLQLFNITDCCTTLQHKITYQDLMLLGCEPPDLNSFMPKEGRLVASPIVVWEYYELMNKISFQEREKFFLQLNQTIVSCTLGRKSCMGAIIRTPPTSLTSQGCFTIFGDRKKKMDRDVPVAGASFGLTVLLRTDLFDYPSSGLAESSGFTVQVHSLKIPPNVDELGFLVSPGTVTRVATYLKKERRKEAPYPSKCMASWNDSLFSPLEWNGEHFTESVEAYTLSECYSMCYQWFIITKCSCFNPRFRIGFTFSTDNFTGSVYDMIPKLKKCGISEYPCSLKYIHQVYSAQNTNCPCGLECQVVSYDLTLTTAAFPTAMYEKKFYKSHNLNNKIGVAVLQVFYSKLEKQFITEQPKYEDISTLVSNIGGIGGAYLGLSLIAFIEFLEMIYRTAVMMIF